MNRFAAAGKAAFAAALINAVLFIASEKIGVMLDSVVIPATAKPVTLGAVITATVITVAFAALVYYLLQRFAKHPKNIFNVLALILLLTSFFTPFSLPGISLTMALLLNLMHVVVAAWVLLFFKTLRN